MQRSLSRLSVLLAAALCACHHHGTDGQRKPHETVDVVERQSCRQFVQGFYDWYFDQLDAESTQKTANTAEDEVLSQRAEILTPKLRQMLKDDAEARGKNRGYIVGLDFDPFINAQDWNGKYTVNSVDMRDSTCRASVWGDDAGKQKEIVIPELNKVGDTWIFVNFHYPDSTAQGNENLIAVLRMLHEEREHPKHPSKN